MSDNADLSPEAREYMQRIAANRVVDYEARDVLARFKRMVTEVTTLTKPHGPLEIYRFRGKLEKLMRELSKMLTEADREMNPK